MAIWSYSSFQRASSPELGKTELQIVSKLKYGQKRFSEGQEFLGRDLHVDKCLDFIIKRCWLCLKDLPGSGAKSEKILKKEKSSSLQKGTR